MGCGTDEHDDWAEEKRADGTWSGPTQRGANPDTVAYRAACSCGWRSEREHPVPARFSNVIIDHRGVAFGPAWDTWIAALEVAAQACHEDWNAEHFEPMLGYQPHQQLMLDRDDGGPCHFLDGRPVRAGVSLQLLMTDGHWQSIRYEWTGDDRLPSAHITLGAPAAARRLGQLPAVEFSLPPRAVLRWPPE